MLEQAFAAGAAFFVTKPFTVESLQAALGPILR
jgi:CheY-like chemotaxis protein